ncbi:MAG TPA: 30S ribosomal protein S9 [Gemmataceae bacterium]|nr:30S ribosomal protein S9 [Gemmataceae bacterium]
MADTKTKAKFYRGTGRRKTAVARVRILEGTGKISINARGLEQFFTEPKDRNAVTGPLALCDLLNRIDVIATVQGGGFTGQAGAISQGLARALKEMFGHTEPAPAPAEGAAEGEAPTPGGFVKKLRDSDYLTRDDRMKERKKYGRKGARKSFQFSKR